MKSKKGVSPLIATVLLIGFAVALAAVVMTWGLGFIEQTADTTEKQTTNTLICASDLDFRISDVTPTSITVDNRGKIDIVSLIFRIHNDNGVDTIDTMVESLTEIEVLKFAVKTFEDAQPLVANPLETALINAGKIEAIATVSGGVGKEDIVCPTNMQEYVITA
jgi:flagellin-like protein